MEEIRIRPAGAEDLPRLISLYGSLYDLMHNGMGVPFELNDPELEVLLPAILRSKLCYLAVAESHTGEICGFVYATVSRMDRKMRFGERVLAGKIQDICVAEGYRGHGLGTRLLASAEAWMQQSGAGFCEGEVALKNTPSMRLFQQNGYHPFCYLMFKAL